MIRLLFRNRWIAFFWMLGILASVAMFFSAGGGHEQLARAASDVEAGNKAPAFSADGYQAFAEPDDAYADPDDQSVSDPDRPSARGKTKSFTLVTRPAAGDEAEEGDAETYVVLDKDSLTADEEESF